MSEPKQDELVAALKDALTNLRYESSRGIGMRGIQEHHVTAIVKCVLPFVRDRIAQARLEHEQCEKEYQETIEEMNGTIADLQRQLAEHVRDSKKI